MPHILKSNNLGQSVSVTENMVSLVTILWLRYPCGFLHWVVFPGLSQGLALICGH